MQIRRYISVFCITLYFVAVSYPFILNASFKLNQTYIAQNLCINRLNPASNCNGKCYLMDQLAGKQNTSATNNAEPFTMNIYEVVPHEIIVELHLVKFEKSIKLVNSVTGSKLSEVFTDIIIPPPKPV